MSNHLLNIESTHKTSKAWVKDTAENICSSDDTSSNQEQACKCLSEVIIAAAVERESEDSGK